MGAINISTLSNNSTLTDIPPVSGFQCVFCPSQYSTDVESEKLCQLWEEKVKIENTPDAVTVEDPTPVVCLYEGNPRSSEALCLLYCELQSYNGHYCCPQTYLDDPEGNILCQLWAELEDLKEANGTELTTDFPLMPVDCLYENNPSSSEILCSLWCEIQTHSGSVCTECPQKYSSDPERILICDLWSELEMVKFDIISEGSITTLRPTSNVTCDYSDHLMSSDLLCEVWCMIQATKGSYNNELLLFQVLKLIFFCNYYEM